MLTNKEIKMAKMTSKNLDYTLDNDVIRHVLEDHLPYLKSRSMTHRVDSALAYRFNHDINGYLTALNIPLGMQWFYLRVNNMQYPWEFNDEMELLLFPKEDDINTIIGQYVASF